MDLALLTDAEPLTDVVPEGGGGIVWVLILAAFVGMYLFTRRSRRRAAEHYRARQSWQEELRANDPDLRRDEPPE